MQFCLQRALLITPLPWAACRGCRRRRHPAEPIEGVSFMHQYL